MARKKGTMTGCGVKSPRPSAARSSAAFVTLLSAALAFSGFACGGGDKKAADPTEDAGLIETDAGPIIETDASEIDAGPAEEECSAEQDAACEAQNRVCRAGACVLTGPAQILYTLNGSEVSDDGSVSATAAIRLSAAPLQDVTVSLSLSGAGKDDVQIAGEQTSLTFTPDSWNTAQSVTIAGVGDEVVDGDKNFALDLTSASSDADFSGLTASVPLVNKDTESYSLKLTLPELLETSEDGGQARIGVRLAARPKSDVTIPVSLSAVYAEVEPESLNFEPDAWNVEQEVTVTGKDDGDAVNNTPHTYQVIFGPLTSEDANFAAIEPVAVDFLNADNDVPRLVANRSSFTVAEIGGSDAISVRLSSEPKVETTVTASISEWCRIRAWNPELHADEIVESTQLVFTPENWETSQQVALTGVEDDGTPDGHHPCTLTLTASSSDTNERTSFNGVTLVIEGENLDMDKVGITMTNEASELSEAGAESDKGYPESSKLCFRLGSRPKQAVRLRLTSSNMTTGATVSPVILSLSHTEAKCAVVKAVDDAVRDFPQEVTVTAETDTQDRDYRDKTLTQKYTVRDRNLDNIVQEYNFKRVLEGDTPTLGFKLGAKPAKDVTVTLEGNNDEQLILRTNPKVTIHPDEWDEFKTARFEAIVDNQVDGNKNVMFTLRSTSEDDAWNGHATSVMFTVMDADKPQIVLSCTATNEKHAYCGSYDTENAVASYTSDKGPVDGGSVTCNVRLATKPSGNVRVRLATGQKAFSSDKTGSTGTAQIFTRDFTPSNYNKDQAVTMYYMPQENAPQAYRTFFVRASVSSDSATAYNAEAVDSGTFERYYTCGLYYFKFKDAPRSVNLPPGKYKLSAWGASGGRPEDKNMQVDENGKFVCFNSGGRGAMVSGELQLTETTPVYVRTGGEGISSRNYDEVKRAYNGGGEGMSKPANCDGIGGGGGGGTDFCASSLDPNPCAKNDIFDDTYFPYRLLSAGGGGGGSDPDRCALNGQAGRGGSGADIESTHSQNVPGSARKSYYGDMSGTTEYKNPLTGNFIPLAQQGTETGVYIERTGSFLYGMSVSTCSDSTQIVHGVGCQRGGGGGGWYGGLAHCGYYSYVGGGGGGSYAFTGTHHGAGAQESKYSLTNVSSIGGDSEMPIYSLYSSGSIIPKFNVSQKKGNIGNGFAVIEVLPVKVLE